MKNLFLIVIVLVIGFVSKAQTPFTTPNLLTGGSTKITQNKGAGQFDSGLVVTPWFPDTATANLSVVSLYGGMLIRVLDTLWLRNEDATRWNKMGGTTGGGGGGGSQTWQQTLTTGSTLTGNNTIAGGNFDFKFNNTDFYVGNLGGDNEKVVWTDNDGLLYRTTFPILSDSLNPYITGLQNGVISGCTVTWIANYDYEVSPCTYRIAGIVYNIPTSTSITLAAADPTNDRIDVFYVNTSSVAAVAQGTPANPAEEPDIDVATQLKISFAVVEAATTQPTLDIDVIYKENAGPPTEWTYSDNTANLNPASTTNPYEGTFDIEGTNVTSGNQFTMTVSPTPVFTDYVFLNFKIRSKATWAAGRVMAIQFFNGVTPVGSTVVFGQGTYGFQSSITANYQNISIPLSDFGNITGATSVRFIRNGTSTIGFYIDNILLLEARSYVVPYVDQVVGISPINVNQVGSLAEVSLQTNGISNSYIRQSAGLSVIGNSTNATANVADITAGTDHYVLRRSGTSLGFGTLNAAAMNPTYTNGYTLQTDGSGNLSWVAASSGGVNALSAIGASPNANGATITGSTLNLEPASVSFGGVLTTGTQGIAGDKTYTGSGTFNSSLFFRGLTDGSATDSLVTIKDHQIFKLNLQNQSPWWRTTLSGAAATTNIVQTRTIADTIVTGGTDVIANTTSPLYKFNHSGNMGVFVNGGTTGNVFGLNVLNATDATAVITARYGPIIASTGTGWKSNATAQSQYGSFGFRAKITTGGSVITNELEFLSASGASLTAPSTVAATLTSGGALTIGGNLTTGLTGTGTVSANSIIAAAGLTLRSSSGNNILIQDGTNVRALFFGSPAFTNFYSYGNQSANTNNGVAFWFGRNALSFSPGTHTQTSGGTTLTGASTYFQDLFRVGDRISMSTDVVTVTAIASNTSLTVTPAWSGTFTGQSVRNTDLRDGLIVRANGLVGINNLSPSALLTVGASSYTFGNNTTVGNQFASIASTVTDWATAASGTVTTTVQNGFGIPTFAAGQTSVTYTNAANVYIAGAPVAGTNMTITNPYSFWVAAGTARFDGRVNPSKGVDIASAGDLTLGSDGNVFIITGTTTINAITTTGWRAGAQVTLIFSSTPTVSNNTAGGANTAVLLLAGGANFNATANDALTLVYDGTSWIETSRSVN